MTKKDYIAIADDIKQEREIWDDCNKKDKGAVNQALDQLVGRLCRTFERDNGRFDYDRFRRACSID